MKGISENKKRFAINELVNFRRIILKDDMFGDMFKRFYEILKFIINNMFNIEMFNYKNIYPQIIKFYWNYKNFIYFKK